MADTKQTKSESAEWSADSDFKSSCCSFENMAQMMQKFCGGEHGSFDCSAMMEKMCGEDRGKSDQQ